ncbi:MAG TPA: YggU family protein [Nitrospirae bacterium]|nr:YggU family protein [Nitrospirota bacterium]
MSDELIITIKVEPRSARPGIAGPYKDGLRVRLSSPPVEGRANKELIAILAKEFKIPKKNVEIITGKKFKNKVVRLHGVTEKR